MKNETISPSTSQRKGKQRASPVKGQSSLDFFIKRGEKKQASLPFASVIKAEEDPKAKKNKAGKSE